MAQYTASPTTSERYGVSLHSIECQTIENMEGMTAEALKRYSTLLQHPMAEALTTTLPE